MLTDISLSDIYNQSAVFPLHSSLPPESVCIVCAGTSMKVQNITLLTSILQVQSVSSVIKTSNSDFKNCYAVLSFKGFIK